MANFVLLALFFPPPTPMRNIGLLPVPVYGSQFHYDSISSYGLEADLEGRSIHALSHPGSKLSPDET